MDDALSRGRWQPPEEALRDSEERFRVAFEHAAIGMAITRRDGSWLKVNRALCAALGYEPNELVGRTFQSLTHPDDRVASVNFLHRALAGEIDNYQAEKRYLHKQGHAVWMSLNAVVVRDCPNAEPYFIAQMHDISERKHAEGVLREAENRRRESEERFRSLSASSPVGIFQSDNMGNITYANPRILQMWGMTEAEALGRGWIVRMHPEDVEAVLAQWGKALEEQREFTHEVRLLMPDGDVRWMRCRSAPLPGARGAVVGTVGTVEDITEQRSLEAQLRQAQKMEAVGLLAGGVAHDFNNILAVVTGYAECLREDLEEGDPRRSDVDEILKGARRAAGLTRQLLAFSRKQVLQPESLDLNQVIAEAATMLRPLLGTALHLVTLPASAPAFIYADRTQIDQVLMNLAVNARDAMPHGGTLTIEVGLEPGHADGGAAATLVVSDTGTGMQPAVLARAFEPFFTTKALGKGTGLGLATVQGIVQQSGGSITVVSNPDEGTRFTISFPLVEQTAPASTHLARAASSYHAGTVLLVEDEEAVRAIARRILERGGYQVLSARHGADALEVLVEHGAAVDVLLSDVVMPELGGLELAARAAERWPGLRVVLMSGYTDTDVGDIGDGALVHRFVQKPFTAESLLDAVQGAVSRSAA